MRITEILPQGFAGYSLNNKSYSLFKVVDKKLPKAYSIGENIELTIEYVTRDKFSEDFITTNQSILYLTIHEFMPRGFFTKEYIPKENVFKRIAMYQSRGYIVFPDYENGDVFEMGDILKVTISKVYTQQ